MLHFCLAIIGMLQAHFLVIVWCPFLLYKTITEIRKTDKIIRKLRIINNYFQMCLTYSKCHFQLMFSA